MSWLTRLFHNPALARIEASLRDITRRITMADLTLADVQTAIADLKTHVETEAGQVKDKLDANTAESQALKDQIAAGNPVSQEQLQGLIDSISATRDSVDNITEPGAPT